MGHRILSVRIRPARVTLLIDKNADETDLLFAVRFFSQLWGGRFGQILPVDSMASDPLTVFRLSELRPDFVYGIGLDDNHWGRAVHTACQPRKYDRLQSIFDGSFRPPDFEEFILADRALLELFRERRQLPANKRTLRLVSCEGPSPWAVFCAVTFGMHHPDLRQEFYDELVEFNGATTVGYVDLASDFAIKWHRNWLDVTGRQLTSQLSTWGNTAPTIVLV